MYPRYADLLDQYPLAVNNHCNSATCPCQMYNIAAWGDFDSDERHDHVEFSVGRVIPHLPECELRAAAHTMLRYIFRIGLPLWDQGHHFNMYGVFELAAEQLASGTRGDVEIFLGSCQDEAVDLSASFLHAVLQEQIPDTPIGRLSEAINAAIHSANARGCGLSLENILSVLVYPVCK
jgi:hypothetical protein